MIYVYESEDGLKLSIEHKGRAKPPRFIHENGIRYDLAGEAYDPKTDTLGHGVTIGAAVRPSQRDGRFESRQLPRWDPHHRGDFSPDGKPRFESRAQAREYARRVQGETGLDSRYGEM